MIDRLGRLRQVLTTLDVDAAIVTHSANRHYFTGYPAVDHAPDETAGVLIVSADSAMLIVSPTNVPWAAAAVRPEVSARAWERPWQSFVAKQLQELGASRVAFEDRAMTVADHRAIAEELKSASLVPAGDAFHGLRLIKDEDELAAITAAARITDFALQAVTSDLEPGVTERQVAWRLEVAMRDMGSHGPAFPTCVAAGPNSARPHHDPSDRQISAGEPIVIDMGATVDGYCADLTRTIMLGDPPPEFRERYNAVLRAQLAALEHIGAGMTGKEADSIARAAIADAGFGDQFIHGLGHGVGLLIHEGPSLGASSDDRLEPGHVVTIEPGIYLEGWGGIRIEDLAVVTSDGLAVLSNAPK